MKEEIKREKFTTTLDPKVIERLGVMKAIYREKGLNYIIEKLVNEKWERGIDNDKDNGEEQRD